MHSPRFIGVHSFAVYGTITKCFDRRNKVTLSHCNRCDSGIKAQCRNGRQCMWNWCISWI